MQLPSRYDMTNIYNPYIFESKQVLHTKKIIMKKRRQFANTFCFIDKLCAINDNSELEKNSKEVYSPELGLKKENVSNRK